LVVFLKYHMKILLGYFNAKMERERISANRKLEISLHQGSNDNGVRIVNFATSKNLFVTSMIIPHRNIHKYTWTNGKAHNQIDHILIVR